MKNLKLFTFLIAFFIMAITFLPLISYTNAKDRNSTIDVTVEIIGIPGLHSKTISLTSAQYSQIKSILNGMNTSIDNDTSKQEAWSILQPLLITLQQYVLLPKSMIFMRIVKNLYYNNYLCTVMGRGLSWKILSTIFIGEDSYENGDYLYYPVNGWVWSDGLKGVIYKNGSLWGQLGYKKVTNNIDYDHTYYKGIVGFHGIYIRPFSFYFGIARHVCIDNNYPW